MRLAQYKLPVKTKFIASDKKLTCDSSGESKVQKGSTEEVKK